MEFKVNEAYAYDPNEERKLHKVISYFDEDFKERIYNLAKLMIIRQEA